MRDYDEKKLLREDPKLYVEKKLTYWVWHWEKIKKSLMKKYINLVDIPEEKRKFLKFLLWDEKHTQ